MAGLATSWPVLYSKPTELQTRSRSRCRWRQAGMLLSLLSYLRHMQSERRRKCARKVK